MALHPIFTRIVDDFRMPQGIHDDALAGAYIAGLNRALAEIRAVAAEHQGDVHAALLCSLLVVRIEKAGECGR